MSRWGKCDFKEIQELQQRLGQANFEAVFREVANEIAMILLNKVKKRTPVGVKPTFNEPKTVKVKGSNGKTRSFLSKSGAIQQQYWAGYVGGKLRDSWRVDSVEKRGNTYVVSIVNPMEYASYVEYGHRQTPGRYVPALGKALKASWVKGRFMLTITEQEVERLSPGLLQKRIEQALKGALNGK